jgi:pimeloyl-ACP methyl ester carboxylesterase
MKPRPSINVAGLGRVSYQKIGDLTSLELNDSITGKTISINGSQSLTSHYQLYNEHNAATAFSETKGAKNGVDLYKIQYTIFNHGRPDKVSGLLAVPTQQNSSTLPLYSWQHGTIFRPDEAPSEIMKNDQFQRTPQGSTFTGQIRSTETLFNLARFAGNGYAMAAADYNGNGSSGTSQYYTLKDPTNKATTAMITAAKGVLSRLGITTNKLFLNGWSQGGLNTLWLGEQLRKDNVAVTKQASSSTFSDINKTANYWFNTFTGDPAWATSCLPLFFASYESYYNLEGLLKEAIKPEYLEIAQSLVNGETNWDILVEPEGKGLYGLPVTGKEMLNEKFREDFNNQRGRFYDKFQENIKIMENKFSHPTRFYGGALDTAIPPGVSVEQPTAFFAPLSAGFHLGAEATHRSTFLGSLFGSAQDPNNDIGTWFQAA